MNEAETVGSLVLNFDDEVRAILGRPCFACIGIAARLRVHGFNIPTKAEEEQAAVARWSLMMYAKHGAAWREKGDEFLRSEPSNAKADPPPSAPNQVTSPQR